MGESAGTAASLERRCQYGLPTSPRHRSLQLSARALPTQSSLSARSLPRSIYPPHFRRGWSCYQTNDDLRLNLQKLDGQRTYASVENHTVLTSSVLTPFALTSLSDYAPLVQNAQLRIPTPLASALIDQLVCSRASTLLLNGFSTFSQLVMGHIGLRHPELIGWTRDLSDAQQRQLKIRVLFWSRADFLRKRA